MTQTQSDRVKHIDDLDSVLRQFCGSERFYRHWTQRAIYTDGMKFLADRVGGHWLIDAIASHLPKVNLNEAAKAMHIWCLHVQLNAATQCREAVLTAHVDDGEPSIVEQRIEYTDFPLGTFKCYGCWNGESTTIMLSSEY